MEQQGFLGIYLAADRAAVVCLDSAAPTAKVLDCFAVALTGQDSEQASSITKLADTIAQGCAQRNLEFSEVAVALDSAFFMQHELRSNFTEHKQIAATVRFDTEEALATDISEVAIAFQVLSQDAEGSLLTIYTAQKKVLSEMITALAANALDAAIIEPDVTSLARFITGKIHSAAGRQPRSLFALLAQRNGYFLAPSLKPKVPERTFLIGPAQDRTKLLVRQVPLTAALAEEEPIEKLNVFDAADSVNPEQLAQLISVPTEKLDLIQAASLDPALAEKCHDIIGLAAAYGAALGHAHKAQRIDFRQDFMPYLAKKRRLEKTLKTLSVSACVIFLALGLHLQLRLFKQNKPARDLRKQFAHNYTQVMLDRKMPNRINLAMRKLESEQRRIKNLRSGLLSAPGQQSVTAKLTILLEALNKVAQPTRLEIEKIFISDRSVRVTGSTSNRSNTLKVIQQIKSKMTVAQQRLDSKGGRDTFNITAGPK